MATYKYTYDFGILGGATGTIALTAAGSALPNNFVINEAWFDVITVLAGGAGATAALTSGEAADDLVAATVATGAPWSTTGRKATLVVIGTIASWIKTTGIRSPALVVAVNALTQGKFNLFINGSVSA